MMQVQKGRHLVSLQAMFQEREGRILGPNRERKGEINDIAGAKKHQSSRKMAQPLQLAPCHALSSELTVLVGKVFSDKGSDLTVLVGKGFSRRDWRVALMAGSSTCHTCY